MESRRKFIEENLGKRGKNDIYEVRFAELAKPAEQERNTLRGEKATLLAGFKERSPYPSTILPRRRRPCRRRKARPAFVPRHGVDCAGGARTPPLVP